MAGSRRNLKESSKEHLHKDRKGMGNPNFVTGSGGLGVSKFLVGLLEAKSLQVPNLGCIAQSWGPGIFWNRAMSICGDAGPRKPHEPLKLDHLHKHLGCRLGPSVQAAMPLLLAA